jgi:hypothetical protein
MIKTPFCKLLFVSALAVSFLFTSCSTKIDLLENYKPITVVYGLLNVNDSIQYIRVNKAFLGEGNALLMAQQSDSINYKPGELNVQLQKINPLTGEVLQTIVCDTTMQIMKDPGIFYNPYQILFKTTAAIDENSNYKLIINRSSDGAQITAVTPIIDSVHVNSPQPIASIGFYNNLSQTYQNSHLNWNNTADAFIYSAALRFTYYETLLISPFTTDTITIELNLGDVLAGNTSIGAEDLPISGEAFFNFVQSSVHSNPDVQRTANDSLEIFLSAGTEDLETYIDVNKPSIGLIQEKPAFTNITNGTGIFSSRWSKTLRNKMTAATLAKLNQVLN